MRYISTRGQAPELSFTQAMMTGLARDGGLYVPKDVPQMAMGDIAALAGKSYEDAALSVIRPFIGDDFTDDALQGIISRAYAGFRHDARAPLVQLAPNHFLLELFHGPTLAFKDFAMQLIGQLMQAELARSGRRVTIVGATSGDTGSAAIEAFKGLANVDVFILFPHGRVSEIQRRQMTTPADANVHALALDGDFDDCQARLKDMFNDHAFRDGVELTAVNSINWARVLAQVVYYFTAAVSLGAPHRAVNFTVPTGNFGDIYAGAIAQRMGLPIDKLVVATNQNDILHRCLTTGRYDTTGVTPSISPSMDIQVSSNFERALFDAYGRDGGAVAQVMDELKAKGGFGVSQGALAGAARPLRLGPGVRGRNRRRDPRIRNPHRRGPVPAQRRWRRCGAGPSGHDADGDAGHRASGKVPRCGRGRHRHAARLAAAYGGHHDSPGTGDAGAQRPGRAAISGPRKARCMTVRLTTLPNGLRIVTEAMPGLASASIGVWVMAGGRHERSEQNGIAHFLEHMAFKGTKRRTALQIAEAIEDVGGYINAYTSRDVTAYYARVLQADVALALDVISDIVLNPVFDPKEIEVERHVILQEIGQALDTPDDIIFDWLQEAAYPDQAIGRTILGPAERVQAFGRGDLAGFVAEHYGPDQMILSAAGAVDHDAIVTLATGIFGALKPVGDFTPEPASWHGAERREVKDLEQVHFALALEGPSYRDPDVYAAQVYTTALGGGMSSRLFQKLREERGLCYSIYAQSGSHDDTGMMTIYAGTSEPEIGDLCDLTIDELKRAAEDMTDAEIARARAQMKAGLLMGLESPSARAERMARMLAIWGRVPTIEEAAEKIDAVGLAEARAFGERLVNAGAGAAMALYGPVGRAPQLDALQRRLAR